MRACLTVDLEQDCPPFLTSYRGIEEGAPALLGLLADEGLPATFFTTGDVARRYPGLARVIVDSGHELGCHGDTHERFDRMERPAAERDLRQASATLRAHGPVVSFRAPNLAFPDRFLPLLEASGYLVDSSQARYKLSHLRRGRASTTLLRVPASSTSSLLRVPAIFRDAVLRRLAEPVVLFVHPWEFIDLTADRRVRLDCRFRTGPMALECLRTALRLLKSSGAQFCRMRDLNAARAASA